MFKKIFIAAFVVAGLVACSKNKSAFKYSQDVVAKERSLEPHIKSTEEKVERYAIAGQFDSIGIAGKEMEDIVQDKMDEVDKIPLPDAKGAKDFKAAIMRYFSYIKSMYTAYKDWGNAATDEARAAEMENIQKLVGEKDDAISDMQSAQKKYADLNGFRIEDK